MRDDHSIRYRQEMNKRRKRKAKRRVLIIILIVIFGLLLTIGIKLIAGHKEKRSENGNDSDSFVIENSHENGTENEQTKPEEVTLDAGISEPVTLTFTGDIILGKHINADYDSSMLGKMDEVQDYGYFLQNFRDLFASDDATIIDMEGCLTESDDAVEKEFNFKAPFDYVNILLQGNVDAATMANNHSHDYGPEGFSDTEETLENNGIKTFGYDKVNYLELKGNKIGLIGAYFLRETDDETQTMLNCIQEAKDNGANIIIVFAHWGIELEYVPGSWQIYNGRLAIDNGADLVVGCHPHVLQGYEEYNGHYIVYSFGNFCFGGNRNPYDKDAYIIQWTANKENGELTTNELNVIPVSVSSHSDYNDYCPRILEGEELQNVWDKINESNAAIESIGQ